MCNLMCEVTLVCWILQAKRYEPVRWLGLDCGKESWLASDTRLDERIRFPYPLGCFNKPVIYERWETSIDTL